MAKIKIKDIMLTDHDAKEEICPLLTQYGVLPGGGYASGKPYFEISEQDLTIILLKHGASIKSITYWMMRKIGKMMKIKRIHFNAPNSSEVLNDIRKHLLPYRVIRRDKELDENGSFQSYLKITDAEWTMILIQYGHIIKEITYYDED